MNFGEPSTYAPRYIDVLHYRQSEDDEEAEYWSQFGFDKLTVPQTATYVNSGWERLTRRFNQRYYFRRIGNETMERWQIRLQNRFDEIVDEMDRAYKLYATTEQIDEVVAGTKTTYGHTRTSTSASLSGGSNEVKNINTPDSEVNSNPDYADALTKAQSSSSSNSNASEGMTGSDRAEVLGPEVLAGVNKSIRDWTDIDTLFIEQFENLFLNIFD